MAASAAFPPGRRPPRRAPRPRASTQHHHAPTTPTAPPTLISTPHLVDELCPGSPPPGASEESERGRRVGTGKLLRPQYSVVAWHSGLPSMGFASWQTEESVAGLVVFVSARIEHWWSDWGPRGRRGKIGISDWSLAAAWSSGFSSDSGVNLPSVVIWPCCRGQLWVRAPMLPCRVGVDFLLPFLRVTPAHTGSCHECRLMPAAAPGSGTASVPGQGTDPG